MNFTMRCKQGHEWIETYPTDHPLFGSCPACPGQVKGKVIEAMDDEVS